MIAFNSGGPVEIIDHDINGFLVDRDFGSYATGSKSYIMTALDQKMGKAGRDIYERFFSANIYKIVILMNLLLY